ncbi:hypothetical protein [Elongatibacter sediminis]|uniref:ACT domain-containing protein n=1 Tax=Elongatibacter sediminis TaxID=3119006 RepID=A0AAW9RGX6_9GAMM
MASGLPNLTGQQDVYDAGVALDRVASPCAADSEVELTVLLERLPGALLRVFGVLCTFELVPERSLSQCAGPDAIRVVFHFRDLPGHRLDLLVRKLRQLTECFEARVAAPDLAVALPA